MAKLSGSAFGSRGHRRISGDVISRNWDFADNTVDEALFQIAHYNRHYHAPASLADILFELGATKSEDKAVVNAIERAEHGGIGHIGEIIGGLQAKDFVERQAGGYITTEAGRNYLNTRHATDWTYLSDLKYKQEYGE